MKLAWSIGHDYAHKGAESIWLKNAGLEYAEFDINKRIVELGTKYLKEKLGNSIDILTPMISKCQNKTAGAVLSEKISIINAWGADIAMESHFNAAGSPEAHGCEVIYFSLPGFERYSKKGKVLADLVQINLLNNLNSNPSRTFKITDRGPVGAAGMSEIIRVYSGNEGPARLAFLTKTKMPSIIIEPYFLSSKGDMECFLKGGAVAQEELESIATGTANGVIEFMKGKFND